MKAVTAPAVQLAMVDATAMSLNHRFAGAASGTAYPSVTVSLLPPILVTVNAKLFALRFHTMRMRSVSPTAHDRVKPAPDVTTLALTKQLASVQRCTKASTRKPPRESRTFCTPALTSPVRSPVSVLPVPSLKNTPKSWALARDVLPELVEHGDT